MTKILEPRENPIAIIGESLPTISLILFAAKRISFVYDAENYIMKDYSIFKKKKKKLQFKSIKFTNCGEFNFEFAHPRALNTTNLYLESDNPS